MYCAALEGVKRDLLKRSRDQTPIISSDRAMHHLTCFFPGVLALGAEHHVCEKHQDSMQLAYQVA